MPDSMATNIAVHIAHDGVSLIFTADSGRQATINVAQLADQLGGETRAALLAWCEDRKRDAATRSSAEQRTPLLAQDYED
jgi:hypothetical protein